MAVNVSVQYNGGSLADIILLTQGYDHWGTHLNAHLVWNNNFINVVESPYGLVCKT